MAKVEINFTFDDDPHVKPLFIVMILTSQPVKFLTFLTLVCKYSVFAAMDPYFTFKVLYTKVIAKSVYACIGRSYVYSILKSMPVAEKLMIVGNSDIQEIFNRYIHDFVLFTCELPQENDDTKVLLIIVLFFIAFYVPIINS